jgi:hypothetical protein
MTEALRPRGGIALGPRPATGRAPLAEPRAASAARAAVAPRAKTKTQPRRPVHIAVAIGFSAGAYAVALAGVTSLQSAGEQALVANRDPASEALDLLQEHHDRLDARLAAAGATYDAAAAAYQDVTDGLSALETRLGTLATKVGKVQTGAAWTPSVWRAPAVSSRAARSSGSTAHATTCASGKVCP